jgi:formylglycine-generating enzyme required for sulfatase activity
MSRLSSPPVVALLVASVIAFGGQRDDPREVKGAGGVHDADLAELASALPGAPAEADGVDEGADVDTDDDEAGDTEATLGTADGGGRGRRRGNCPHDMARVREFCVDRFEAPNRRGDNPLVMQSATEAEAWCTAKRKRLCTEDEWIAACEGDEGRPYPYGAVHVDDRCNDDQPWRTVDGAKLATWPAPEAKAHVHDLYQADPSGARSQCVSEAGVHDLTGNVEEWVVRTRPHANAWPHVLIGCYWSGCYGGGKPTCRSTNNAHGPGFRFYETGFRCCRDAVRAR